MKISFETVLKYSLAFLLLLLALNAFGGGVYGMAGAKRIPTEWLQNSPFTSYFIPGMFLFVVIGGLSFLASIAVFKEHPFAIMISFSCAILVLVWLSIQVLIIGYVSPMQPITAIASVVIIILSMLLSRVRR